MQYGPIEKLWLLNINIHCYATVPDYPEFQFSDLKTKLHYGKFVDLNLLIINFLYCTP